MALKKSTLKHLDEFRSRNPHLTGLAETVTRAVEAINHCTRNGGKILLCGNGGSAADCEHIAGELVKSFILPRLLPPEHAARLKNSGVENGAELAKKLQRGVAAVALTSNAAAMTAIANDTDASLVFAQQVYVLGRPGDILIGLSTSGNSKNVVNALAVARASGLTTIGFTGVKPAAMDALSDILFKAPESETFKIQECHAPLYHAVCLMVEEELFGSE
jgi:D-sedoheptulose 7-phosphate isomerase